MGKVYPSMPDSHTEQDVSHLKGITRKDLEDGRPRFPAHAPHYSQPRDNRIIYSNRH